MQFLLLSNFSTTNHFMCNILFKLAASIGQLSPAFGGQKEVENRVAGEIDMTKLPCYGYRQFSDRNAFQRCPHDQNPAQNADCISRTTKTIPRFVYLCGIVNKMKARDIPMRTRVIFMSMLDNLLLGMHPG